MNKIILVIFLFLASAFITSCGVSSGTAPLLLACQGALVSTTLYSIASTYTYTAPANAGCLGVSVLGAGGFGATGSSNAGGGGGSGGFAQGKFTIGGGSQFSLTVGAAGNSSVASVAGYSSFSNLLVGGGGGGGAPGADGAGANGASTSVCTGGVGGTGSGGLYAGGISGANGTSGAAGIAPDVGAEEIIVRAMAATAALELAALVAVQLEEIGAADLS